MLKVSDANLRPFVGISKNIWLFSGGISKSLGANQIDSKGLIFYPSTCYPTHWLFPFLRYDVIAGGAVITSRPVFGQIRRKMPGDVTKRTAGVMLLSNCNLLTEEPLDIVKSKRSNYNRFEILKQLSKLNELIYTETVSLFDSYISSHPNYMYNIRERANIIMKSLTDNQDFNPPYMEKVFNQYSRILDENVEDYGRLYYKIVGKPSSDTYNRYDRNRILNSIVSKSSWKSLGNGDMEMVVKFNDGKEVTVCYSPGKEQNECSYYVPSKIIGRDWYATLDDAIVAAYRKAW